MATLRLKPATLIILWVLIWVITAEAQRVSMLLPQGTLAISCRLDNASYPTGTIYLDGQKVGSCPGVTDRFFAGTHSVRVGVDLGNNRYLVYQNEQVEVREDSTQNITASLAYSTSDKSPALAFALGVKPLATLPYTDAFNVAVFSPNASIVAINAETNSVHLYDAASGETLSRLGVPGEYWVSFVTELAFSADGQTLASNGWLVDKYIGEINIWDVKQRRLRRTIPGVERVCALALSRDGQLVAAGIKPNRINLWRVADGKLLQSIHVPGDNNDSVSPLFFSPDGRLLIFGHGGGEKIFIYDAVTAERRRTLPGRMATLIGDGRLRTYSFKDQATIRNTWRSPLGELTESKPVRYSPGKFGPSELTVVGSLEVWNTRTEQLLVRLPGYYALALSDDGRRLLVNGDGGYRLWSLPAIPDKVP